MKEYKATIAYFKKEYPDTYAVVSSIAKSVSAGLVLILCGYIANPESFKVVSISALGFTLLRLIATSVAYQLSKPNTEVKTSKI